MKILFCGGCNPLYNRVLVYEKVKDLKINSNILLLNGCHRGCKKISKDEKCINVQEFLTTHSSIENYSERDIIVWIYEQSKKK